MWKYWKNRKVLEEAFACFILVQKMQTEIWPTECKFLRFSWPHVNNLIAISPWIRKIVQFNVTYWIMNWFNWKNWYLVIVMSQKRSACPYLAYILAITSDQPLTRGPGKIHAPAHACPCRNLLKISWD